MIASAKRSNAGCAANRDSVAFRGRRYRLIPTGAQAVQLAEWSGALRALWNAALEQRRTAWRQCGASVGLLEQCRELTDARAAIPWLADVPAQAAQQTLRDLDRAFQEFFATRARHPRFRSRRQESCIRFPQGVRVRRLSRRWGEVKLPKLGSVRFRWTRALDGNVRHATVTRDALGWHVSLCVQLDAQLPPPCGGPAVGVDRGVCALVATSDGELVTGEFWSAGERRRHRALQQRLARQQRGSARRQATVERIARLRARVVRRRRDVLHKVSHRLATEHRLVAVESLDVGAMTRSARGSIEQPGRNVRAKAALNRAILDRGWGELHRQLQYKCRWYGSQLVAVDARYTSQTCSVCGTTDGRSRESQARYACRHCGHAEHSDINAARVILARALTLTAGGSPVTARGGLAGGRPVKREPPAWEAA